MFLCPFNIFLITIILTCFFFTFVHLSYEHFRSWSHFLQFLFNCFCCLAYFFNLIQIIDGQQLILQIWIFYTENNSVSYRVIFIEFTRCRLRFQVRFKVFKGLSVLLNAAAKYIPLKNNNFTWLAILLKYFNYIIKCGLLFFLKVVIMKM